MKYSERKRVGSIFNFESIKPVDPVKRRPVKEQQAVEKEPSDLDALVSAEQKVWGNFLEAFTQANAQVTKLPEEVDIEISQAREIKDPEKMKEVAIRFAEKSKNAEYMAHSYMPDTTPLKEAKGSSLESFQLFTRRLQRGAEYMQALRLQELLANCYRQNANYLIKSAAEAIFPRDGYKDINALFDHFNELNKDRAALRNKYAGVGKFINSQELKKISLDLANAKKIFDLYYGTERAVEGKYGYVSYEDVRKRGFEIDGLALEKARANMENFLTRISSRNKEGVKADLEKVERSLPQLVKKLNETFVDTYALPEIKRRLLSADDMDVEDEDLKGYIRETVLASGDVPVKPYSNAEPEIVARQEHFFSEVDKNIAKAIKATTATVNPNTSGNRAFEHMARFVAERPRNEAEKKAYLLARDGLTGIDKSFRYSSKELAQFKNEVPDRHPALKYYYSTGVVYDQLEYFDLPRWEVLRSHPETINIFGPEAIKEADKLIAEQILENVLKVDGRSSNAEYWGKNLFMFKQPEVVPIAVMHALRTLNYGKRPLLRSSNYGSISLVDYVTSLDGDTLRELKEQNIAGLFEMLNEIQAHPKTFEDPVIIGGKQQRSAFDIYTVKLCNYFLRQANPHTQRMALEVLQNTKTDLAEIAEALNSIAAESKDQGVVKEFVLLVQTKLIKEKNTGGADIFLRHFGELEKNSQDAKSSLDNIIVNYLNYELPKPEVLQKMAYNKGTTTESLTRVYNFLLKLRESNIPYEAGNLDGYIQLSDNPEALPTILYLRPYGYKFEIGHLNLMPEIIKAKENIKNVAQAYFTYGYVFHVAYLELIPEFLEKKEEYINSIKEIKRIYPRFTYAPQSVGGAYGSPLTWETDPNNLFFKYQIEGAFSAVFDRLSDKEALTNENWVRQLTAYVAIEEDLAWSQQENWGMHFKDMFSAQNSQNREVVLVKMREQYNSLIADKGEKFLPIEVRVLLAAIEKGGGAGNLKYVELLGQFMNEVQKSLTTGNLSQDLKTEICNKLEAQEGRFQKERWSEEDRSQFYAISQDLLKSSPTVYRECLNVLSGLSPKEMLRFNREIMPLYQARLALIRSGEEEKENYDTRHLLGLQKQLSALGEKLSSISHIDNRRVLFEKLRAEQVELIQGGFKEKFGLLKVPEVWDEEKMRFVQNFVRYLGNVNRRDTNKENLIALYLGLNLNGEWEKFRTGEEISLEEYFQEPRLSSMRQYVENRKKQNTITADSLGIDESSLAEVQKLLQQEILVQLLGSIQTIDEKLGALTRSLQDLSDEDAYPTQKDKQLLRLSKDFGKEVGASLARHYQGIAGKGNALSEKQDKIIQTLKEIYGVSEFLPAQIKTIQEELKAFSLVTNTLNAIEEKEVNKEIMELQNRLVPSQEIIEIFNRLGEDFRPGSGAFAISQDLTYLENIMVKDADKLNPQDKELLDKYLQGIREQMQKLERVYLEFVLQVDKIRQSAHGKSNVLLQNRLNEISKAINAPKDASEILGRMTTNFNLIIENMRQCLGCLKKEANNDTNLAFGDNNKFYLLSQTPESRGSVADEIAFLLPVKYQDGRQEMSFVMDHLYGNRSGDILSAHVSAIVKKMQLVKRKYPEAKLSIFVTNSALSSGGQKQDLLIGRLQKAGITDLEFEEVNENIVTVPQSTSGDNYIEFGGGAREAGERAVSGLMIRHKT